MRLAGELVGVVERKTLADLAGRLVDGQLAYLLAELATAPRSAVVVEDRYADVFKLEHVQPGWVADLLAAMVVRYPTVPVVFCDTRPLAEEWTYPVLGSRPRVRPLGPGRFGMSASCPDENLHGRFFFDVERELGRNSRRPLRASASATS